MKVNTLHELFVSELKDLYNAESQLTKALPKMVQAAKSPRLKQALQDHLDVTQEQKERLEQIFQQLDENPKGRKCKAMEGLIAEGEEAIELSGEDAVLDAAIIAAAQRVEHYEIAGYGTVRTFAGLLGYDDAVELLQTTLDEEGEADHLLTEIAESEINKRAVAATSE